MVEKLCVFRTQSASFGRSDISASQDSILIANIKETIQYFEGYEVFELKRCLATYISPYLFGIFGC